MVKLFHVDSLLQVSDSPQPSSRPSWLWWKGGSKGRNHQVRQRLKSICSHLKLSDTLWQPSCFGWNPGLQSLKNHTCVKVSFQGQQAQNSQLYWSTTKSPKCLHGTNRVPKTSSRFSHSPTCSAPWVSACSWPWDSWPSKVAQNDSNSPTCWDDLSTCSSQGSKASSGDLKDVWIFL